MKSGFLRVAATAPRVNVADVDANVDAIIDSIKSLSAKGVELIVFPELSITAYTCADLFLSDTLLSAAASGLERIVAAVSGLDTDVIVGLPVAHDGAVYNCAALIRGSRVDLVAKTFVPNYGEFYERRWWHPAPAGQLTVRIGSIEAVMHSSRVFDCHGVGVGIEICEDLWVPVPPSCRLAMAGATVICNLSASDDLIGKRRYLESLTAQQSARCLAAYVYAGAGFGESSTDLAFDGKAIIAENGRILVDSPRWCPDKATAIADIDILALDVDRRRSTTFADCARRELSGEFSVAAEPIKPSFTESIDLDLSALDFRTVDPRPFVPADDDAIDARCEEIINIQAAGLARRLDFIHATTLVVGISGGLDSTLALLVAAKTFDRLGLDRKGIVGVTMPGFGTTGRTHTNAVRLMETLGVTIREISIKPAVEQHFTDIGHNPDIKDVTYENSQARYRTMLLMDIANQAGGIVLGTGDLSELALGWATYNGDQMSMYGVNAGVPKTLVRYLVRWFARQADNALAAATLNDIIDTPISPELIPAEPDGTIKQKTEDLVGPYELHDFFLYYTLRYGFTPRRVMLLALKAFKSSQYSPSVIKHWLKTFYRRFFTQQFKRSCMPDGPKVGSVCLSPRGDWRMPSDASSALWLKEVESINF